MKPPPKDTTVNLSDKPTREELKRKAEKLVRLSNEGWQMDAGAGEVAQALLDEMKWRDNHDCWAEAVDFAMDQTGSPGPTMGELRAEIEKLVDALVWLSYEQQGKCWCKKPARPSERMGVPHDNTCKRVATAFHNRKALLQGKES